MGYEADRRPQIPTAAVRFAVTHLGAQNARSDGANSRNCHQALAQVTLCELAAHFLSTSASCSPRYLKGAFKRSRIAISRGSSECSDRTTGRRVTDSFADGQADTKRKQEAVDLIDRLYPILHRRIANAV